jgi:hypothetical protein
VRRTCGCRRCRHLPSPEEIGDQHEVAVVLYLDAESARNVAAMHPVRDMGGRELDEAADRWERLREAIEREA